MKIGLCTVIGVVNMQVIAYACTRYEVALGQALENMKGVKGPVLRRERQNARNGFRETTFVNKRNGEVVCVQEVEVSDAVLPVPDGPLPTFVDM